MDSYSTDSDCSLLALKKTYRTLDKITNNFWENVLERFYSFLLCDGDISIDVGAHIGRHLLPMAMRVGPSGKVYAFEPLDDVRNRLKKAITLNEIDSRVVLSSSALSSEAGVQEYFYDVDEPGLSGLKERTSHAGHNLKKMDVKVETLDQEIPKDIKVKFIKIDAEGGDFFILKGAERILTSSRPAVIFESGRINAFPAVSYGYTKGEFNSYFKRIDYVLYDIGGFSLDLRFWDEPTLNDFVAFPAESERELRNVLQAAVLCVMSDELVTAKA